MSAPGAVFFVVPGSLDAMTGGTIYDRRVVQGLRGLGRDAEVVELDTADATPAFAAIPSGSTVVVDGLVLGTLPEIARREATRLDLVALVHHPLADETGLDPAERTRLEASERAALAHVARVVVTSDWTAARLVDAGLVPASADVRVVVPGVDPAPASDAGASDPVLRFVSVGALTPRKAYDDAAAAFAAVGRDDWTWTVIGRSDQDASSARRTRDLVERLGLGGRAILAGALSDADRDAELARAHVFLHPARYEGYGMAVAEALARGLPVIASTGGALGDTVPESAGLTFEPGDTAALASALTRVLEDREGLLASLRSAAVETRANLPGWDDVARAFAAALERVPA
ncbi:MAG: glycosyltransferase family 4 protein [Planctomycetota bacterium]